MPLYHVPRPLQADVVDTLLQLIEGAHQGQVVGLAVAAVLPQRRYITAAAGECYRDPTYARGVLRVLDDDLARMVYTRALQSTR